MITIHANDNSDNTLWLKKNNNFDLFRILKSPSVGEMLSLLQDSVSDVSIKFKMDPRIKGVDFNGQCYVWNSYYATHEDIMAKIVKARISPKDRFFFLTINPKNKKYYIVSSDLQSQDDGSLPEHLTYLGFKKSMMPNIYT
jgi:hypothetical protein